MQHALLWSQHPRFLSEIMLGGRSVKVSCGTQARPINVSLLDHLPVGREDGERFWRLFPGQLHLTTFPQPLILCLFDPF